MKKRKHLLAAEYNNHLHPSFIQPQLSSSTFSPSTTSTNPISPIFTIPTPTPPPTPTYNNSTSIHRIANSTISHQIMMVNKEIWTKEEVLQLIQRIENEYEHKLSNQMSDYIRQFTSSHDNNDCSYIS